MTKGTFTFLFTVVSTLVNIILTFTTIAIISVIFFLLCKVLAVKSPNVIILGLGFCFIIGMLLNVFTFTKLTGWVVRKFDLTSKLDSKFVAKSLPGVNYSKKTVKEKVRTNMPKSVLPSEDDLWENKANSTYQSFGIEELQSGIAKSNAEAQALIRQRKEEADAWEKSKESEKE